MRVCIVGAGLTGLTAGYRLSKNNHEVTIIEKEPFIGGMMSSFSEEGDVIPKTYHHIMKFDDITRKLLRELGLADKYIASKTKMGFYYGGKINKMSTPFDLPFFSPLSISARIRFGIFGLKVLMRKNWDEMENVTAQDWILKEAGPEVYNKMFLPLLKTKFSSDYDRIIARWVGERLKLKESSGPFGYVKGGLDQMLEAMRTEIEKRGSVLTETKVARFNVVENKITSVVYERNGVEETLETDCVIYTGPTTELRRMAAFPKEFLDKISGIKYKSTLCAAIGFDQKLSDYYWINLIDGDFKFGGIIFHSVLNPHLNAKTMLYLFTYLDKSDDFWKKSDERILDTYLDDLEKIFPNAKNHVKWKHLFRIEHSKPVYDVDYKSHKLYPKSPLSNLYLGGIATFYPRIRNMGTSIENGENLADLVGTSDAL